jgi:hypothetical protein
MCVASIQTSTDLSLISFQFIQWQGEETSKTKKKTISKNLKEKNLKTNLYLQKVYFQET